LHSVERFHELLIIRKPFRNKDAQLDSVEVGRVFFGIESIDGFSFASRLQLDVRGILRLGSEQVFKRMSLCFKLFGVNFQKGLLSMK